MKLLAMQFASPSHSSPAVLPSATEKPIFHEVVSEAGAHALHVPVLRCQSSGPSSRVLATAASRASTIHATGTHEPPPRGMPCRAGTASPCWAYHWRRLSHSHAPPPGQRAASRSLCGCQPSSTPWAERHPCCQAGRHAVTPVFGWTAALSCRRLPRQWRSPVQERILLSLCRPGAGGRQHRWYHSHPCSGGGIQHVGCGSAACTSGHLSPTPSKRHERSSQSAHLPLPRRWWPSPSAPLLQGSPWDEISLHACSYLKLEYIYIYIYHTCVVKFQAYHQPKQFKHDACVKTD